MLIEEEISLEVRNQTFRKVVLKLSFKIIY